MHSGTEDLAPNCANLRSIDPFISCTLATMALRNIFATAAAPVTDIPQEAKHRRVTDGLKLEQTNCTPSCAEREGISNFWNEISTRKISHDQVMPEIPSSRIM